MKRKNNASPRKAGQQAQDEFTKRLTTLVKGLEKTMQLEIEPNVSTINNMLNKKDKKSAAKKPAVKKETPMKRRFRAGPTAGSGLGSQRRSGTLRGKNVVANPPKRKNKDTAKKPRRPSRPSMTGFRK